MKTRRLKKTKNPRVKKSSRPRAAKKCRPAKSRRHHRRALTHRRVRRRSVRPAANSNSPQKKPSSVESLDFPDRRALYPFEIAKRMGCCTRHVYDLIHEGQLRAIDISRRNTFTDRRTIRIPIEYWHQFLLERTV